MTPLINIGELLFYFPNISPLIYQNIDFTVLCRNCYLNSIESEDKSKRHTGGMSMRCYSFALGTNETQIVEDLQESRRRNYL